MSIGADASYPWNSEIPRSYFDAISFDPRKLKSTLAAFYLQPDSMFVC